MKKYLREIEIGTFGGWLCGIGLFLMLLVFLYKAFHWKEYERENKQYIMIILLTIVILFIQLLTRK